MKSERGIDSALKEREVTAASFDDANKDALTVALGGIEQVKTTLMFASLKSSPPELDPQFHALSLFNRAWETLISSVHLARHRVPVDAFALLRVAVETAAVAVHINTEPVAFKSYVGFSGKKYKATKAIKPVGSFIPLLPEVYGAFSQAAVHANVRTYGPSYDTHGAQVVHLFSREVDPFKDRHSLRCISLAAALVFRALELVFFDNIPSRPGWLRLHGSSMIVTATAENLVEQRFKEFTSGEQ